MAKENKKEHSQKLPDCAIEFIKQVIKKMRYRRKVGKDVQAELSAHFEDELKVCSGEQEKQQKAQQLITDFGDIKLLAVLLRRAKKRCRPLWRTIIARSFQTIGVLILFFIFYVIWFLSGKPAITTNYVAELNDMVRPVADESLNAAAYYEKAAESYKDISDEFLIYFADNYKEFSDEDSLLTFDSLAEQIKYFLSNPTQQNTIEEKARLCNIVPGEIHKLRNIDLDELTVAQKDLLQRWIIEQNDALELLTQGAQKPHFWIEYKSGSTDTSLVNAILLPELNVFRHLTRTLIFRIRLNAEQGFHRDVLEDILSCYLFGKHLKGDKSTTEQLLGIAIENLANSTFRKIVSNYNIDSALLAEFQQNFERIIENEDFHFSYQFEKLSIYDEIQRSFTSDSIGKGHIYLPRLKEIVTSYEGIYLAGSEDIIVKSILYLDMAPYFLAHPNKEETIKTAQLLSDYYEQIFQKTPAQIHKEKENVDNRLNEIVGKNYFLYTLYPALGRINVIANRVETEVRANLTIISLIRYKQDSGQYPEDLNELVTKGYLKQLPIDTFSDEPLVYKQTDEDFLLYSYGKNCIDDGGQPAYDSRGNVDFWSDKGDTIFWPVME